MHSLRINCSRIRSRQKAISVTFLDPKVLNLIKRGFRSCLNVGKSVLTLEVIPLFMRQPSTIRLIKKIPSTSGTSSIKTILAPTTTGIPLTPRDSRISGQTLAVLLSTTTRTPRIGGLSSQEVTVDPIQRPRQ
uniref:Movement protein n=1 Tax=Strongyloides papillosus TaxID=174720 RepID=A0A0N5B3V7_STREA